MTVWPDNQRSELGKVRYESKKTSGQFYIETEVLRKKGECRSDVLRLLPVNSPMSVSL